MPDPGDMAWSVLVVDDSLVVRKALHRIIEDDDRLSWAGEARDGAEAVEMAEELEPDLITLDIEMPVMDGLEALDAIMTRRPTPVLVVSHLTTEGARVTLDALERGAVDFIPKAGGGTVPDMAGLKDALRQKVDALEGRLYRLRPGGREPAADPTANGEAVWRPSDLEEGEVEEEDPAGTAEEEPVGPPRGPGALDLVVVGASTGGPPVLSRILGALPDDLPAAVLVAAHIPGTFTGPFAEQIRRKTPLRVAVATGWDALEPGSCVVVPGEMGATVTGRGRVRLDDPPEDGLYAPSIDDLLGSVATSYGPRSLGVILTGMGDDGTAGLGTLLASGGRTLVQAPETCTVDAMPRHAIEAGVAEVVLPPHEIAAAIAAACSGEAP